MARPAMLHEVVHAGLHDIAAHWRSQGAHFPTIRHKISTCVLRAKSPGPGPPTATCADPLLACLLRRYGALKSLGEKKQCFNEYLQQRRNEEKEEERRKSKQVRGGEGTAPCG